MHSHAHNTFIQRRATGADADSLSGKMNPLPLKGAAITIPAKGEEK